MQTPPGWHSTISWSITPTEVPRCKDLPVMSLIRNEECGAQIISKITVLLMMRINCFFLLLTPWCHSLGHAQRQPLGCYNRWQGSFSHHNWPSMGKGKTELPKASGEMLKTTKGSAHSYNIWLFTHRISIHPVNRRRVINGSWILMETYRHSLILVEINWD